MIKIILILMLLIASVSGVTPLNPVNQLTQTNHIDGPLPIVESQLTVESASQYTIILSENATPPPGAKHIYGHVYTINSLKRSLPKVNGHIFRDYKVQLPKNRVSSKSLPYTVYVPQQNVTATNVKVAVIDSGVNYNHVEFSTTNWYTNPNEIPGNKIDDDKNGLIDDVNGWNFANRNGNTMDDFGHGTYVHGLLHGKSVGSAPGATILPIKVFDRRGVAYMSNCYAAIEYASAQSADIQSISWGIYKKDTALRIELEASQSLFVIAAGNNNWDLNKPKNDVYPAEYRFPNTLSIAAEKEDTTRASFSNYGNVDVSTLGNHVYSSSIKGYGPVSGTSFATPHVAGIIATTMSEQNCNAISAKAILITKCRPNGFTYSGSVY